MHSWEDRFNIEAGYIPIMKEGISGLLQKYDLKPGDFDKVVLYAYDVRRLRQVSKIIGFSPDQVQDPLLDNVGHTGTASVPMMLVNALETSKPDDRILVANYGDGIDAYILKVTENIRKIGLRKGVKGHLDSKMALPSYGKYVHFRNLMEWQSRFQPAKYASLSMSWRDRSWILGCKGSRCNNCGNICFPPQRICSWCHAKDNYVMERLSDRKGKLFSYSLDNLAVTIDPPTVISIVNLDGGGRFSTTMTDRIPEKLSTDMPVELTFRRFHDSKNIHNYFWKSRPVR